MDSKSIFEGVYEAISAEAFKALLLGASERWAIRSREITRQIESKPLRLFGFGGKGRALAHQLRQITGRNLAIYDSSPEKIREAEADGFTVLSGVSSDSEHWVTILGACQAQAEQVSSVPSNTVYFHEAAIYFDTPHLSNSVRDFQSQILDRWYEHYRVLEVLHPESRARFIRILEFRLHGDPTCLLGFRAPVNEMWVDIPDAQRRRPYATVLDVGAFDGDTLRLFRDRLGFSRGIAVEANASMFGALEAVGRTYPAGITIVPAAAWSKRTRLRFDEVRFGMWMVSESDGGSLEAAALDDFIVERVDLLKMDIEGAELNALLGCKSTIQNSMPDLAIAAYHRPEDFLEILDRIREFGYDGGSFEFHVGHYSDCLDDSIVYAIRKKG